MPLTLEELRRRVELRDNPYGDLAMIVGDERFLHERAVEHLNHEAASRHASALASLLRTLNAAEPMSTSLKTSELAYESTIEAQLQARPELLPLVIPILRQLDNALHSGRAALGDSQGDATSAPS